ncbi:unnamed protein product, partial [Nesidiocoris tenuis]
MPHVLRHGGSRGSPVASTEPPPCGTQRGGGPVVAASAVRGPLSQSATATAGHAHRRLKLLAKDDRRDGKGELLDTGMKRITKRGRKRYLAGGGRNSTTLPSSPWVSSSCCCASQSGNTEFRGALTEVLVGSR